MPSSLFWNSLMCIHGLLNWSVFSLEMLTSRPGLLLFSCSGKGAHELFKNEGGGHRWQRTPPTEKRNRVHTSTITVAVLEEATASEVRIDKRDLEVKTCRGSGAGGQHRNVTDSAVQMLHVPTGIRVRVESERSQHMNYQVALNVVRSKIKASQIAGKLGKRNEDRKAQVGSGMRGDKIRTIQVRNDRVVDHRTGKRISYRKFSRGHLRELH